MSPPDPTAREDVAGALVAAMNAHDVDAFVSLFAEDYDSQQPAHPDRAFVGSEQVRANWASVFAGVPDFHAELIGAAVEADRLWTEWRWRGTHDDGTRMDMAGVIVLGVHAGQITWARLYMEPVETGDDGIDAVVRTMSGNA